MTFDDWWGAYPTKEDYEANCRDAWEAGAASRDAEIAGLKHAIHDFTSAMFSVEQERNQLREHVKMLREGMVAINTTGVMREAKWTGMSARDIARFTLAATEPKE